MGLIGTLLEIPNGYKLIAHNFSSDSENEQNPFADHAIILVQGFGADRHSLDPIAHLLGKMGFKIFSFKLGPLGLFNVENIEKSAQHIVAELKKLNLKKVSFVAHSMGGLIVLSLIYLFKEIKFFVDIEKVIMLGSPIQGVWLADMASKIVGKYLPCVAEMCHGSRLIRQLQNEILHHPPKFKLISVAGESDFIVPPESAKCPNAENIVIQGVGHAGLVTSHKAQRLLSRLITT